MRSPKKRSLLGVNELFEGKRNAEITLLDGFFCVREVVMRWDGGGGLKTLHYGINLEGEAKDHDNRRKRYATPREDVVTVSVFVWKIFCSIALTV